MRPKGHYGFIYLTHSKGHKDLSKTIKKHNNELYSFIFMLK